MDTGNIGADDCMTNQPDAGSIAGAMRATSRQTAPSPWSLAPPILTVASTVGIAALGLITFVTTFPPGSALGSLALAVVITSLIAPVLWACHSLGAQLEALKIARGLRALEETWEVAMSRARSAAEHGSTEDGHREALVPLAAAMRRPHDRDRVLAELERRLEDIGRREETYATNLIQHKERGR